MAEDQTMEEPNHGSILRQVRQIKGLTHLALALLAGLSVSTIRRAEKSRISRASWGKIRDALNRREGRVRAEPYTLAFLWGPVEIRPREFDIETRIRAIADIVEPLLIAAGAKIIVDATYRVLTSLFERVSTIAGKEGL